MKKKCVKLVIFLIFSFIALTSGFYFLLPTILFPKELQYNINEAWKGYRQDVSHWSAACEGQEISFLKKLIELEGPENKLGGLPKDLCSKEAETYSLSWSAVRDSLKPLFAEVSAEIHKSHVATARQVPIDPGSWKQVKGSWKFPWYAEVLYLHFDGKNMAAAKELESLLKVASYKDQCPIFENKSVTRPMYRDCARLALLLLPALPEETIGELSTELKKGLNSFALFDAGLKNHFLLIEKKQIKPGEGPLAIAERILFRAEAVSAIKTISGKPDMNLEKAAIGARKILTMLGKHPLRPTPPVHYLERYNEIEGLVRTVIKAMEMEQNRRETGRTVRLETPEGGRVTVTGKSGCYSEP